MAEDVKPPAPATPPAGATGDEKWRGEYFKAESERKNLEKQVGTLTAEVEGLKTQTTDVQKSGVEHLRLKRAYEAGVPSHLLNLVTANTDEEISTQIKTIMGEFTPSSTDPPPGGNGKPIAPTGTEAVKAAEAALAAAEAAADPVKAAEAVLQAARVAADPIKAAEAVLEAAKAAGTTGATIPKPPPPSGIPGESQLEKYTKATPEEQQKMMQEWKDTPGFVLT